MTSSREIGKDQRTIGIGWIADHSAEAGSCVATNLEVPRIAPIAPFGVGRAQLIRYQSGSGLAIGRQRISPCSDLAVGVGTDV